MKFNLIYLRGTLLLALICLLFGCGKKGTESKIQPGNLSDPAYLEALNTTIESAELSGNAIALAVERVYGYLSLLPSARRVQVATLKPTPTKTGGTW